MNRTTTIHHKARRLICLANHAPAAAEALELANFAPSPEGFTREQLAAGVWVPIAVYGDLPNKAPNGVMVTQRFTRADAEKMVQEWGSLVNSVRRWKGLPWVKGHPDHKGEEAPAIGRMTQIEAKEDALYGFTRFNSAGVESLANDEFSGHSVRWLCLPERDGPLRTGAVVKPFRLISVGLVEHPNMHNLPPITVVNESPGDAGLEQQPGDAGNNTTETNTMPDWLISQFKELGVITGDETPEEQQAKITAALNKLKPSEEAESPKPEEMAAANSQIKSLREQIARIQADGHVAAGRLVVPLANQWVEAAANARNPAEFAATLASMDAKAKETAGPKTTAALKNAAPGTAAAQQALNNSSDDAKIAARARELRAGGMAPDAAYRQAVSEAGKA